MKFMSILFFSGVLTFASAAYASEYTIDHPATITGKIATIKSLHPNPEFRGEKQIAIRPHRKLQVKMSDGSVVNTQLIQLISSDIPYKRLFAQEHQNVRLYCTSLFEQETAHHTTKILCDVEKVEISS